MDALLCTGGCGFYGSAATNNLCSQCFKLYAKARQEKEPAKEATKNYVLALPCLSRSSNEFSGKESVNHRDTSSVKVDVRASTLSSVGTKKNRCKCCNKKYGLMGFDCRCGETFCGTHRYPEAHACKHDFKKEGRVAIEKANPVCRADKLESRV